MKSPFLPALLAVLALAVMGIASGARAQGLSPILTSQLEVERELLAEDLRLLAAARTEQQEALAAFTAALDAIDARLETREVSLEGLEALEDEARRTRRALDAANTRAETLRHEVHQRLRRTGVLAGRIEDLEDGPQVREDPLSGEWNFTLEPDLGSGTLRLSISGETVTGSYDLGEEGQGTVSGSFRGSRLRLQRTDGRGGRDLTLEAEIDPVTRQIRGTWTRIEPSAGDPDPLSTEPDSGTWEAEKVEELGSREVPR